MKILYLTDSRVDYLADSILHGLIELLGDGVVDYPEKEILYSNSSHLEKSLEARSFPLYGNGFSLYGLLQPRKINRTQIVEKIEEGYFDLVIVSSLWKQWNTFMQVSRSCKGSNVLFLDGEDDDRSYFESSVFFKSLCLDTWKCGMSKARIAKREWNNQERTTLKGITRKTVKSILRMAGIKSPDISIGTSFGIPEAHIMAERPIKSRLFTSHVVDPELRTCLGIEQPRHIFTSQEDYYRDIQRSQFAASTRRGGWDCLRHYEIAANRAIICFRDLDTKPVSSAPHGLNASNCIVYNSSAELLRRCKNMNAREYEYMEAASYEWVQSMSTINVAKRLLDDLETV